MIKVTFMGAGSSVFAKNVLGDCMLTPALKDLELLRKQRFRMPELIGFSCKPALGQLTVKHVITIPADSWYALFISMNNLPKNAWNRVWGVKLEKLP